LTAALLGNAGLRIASGAGGVLVGLYLANLANTGRGGGAELAGTLGAVSFGTELAGSIPLGMVSDALAPRILMTAGALLGAFGTQILALAGTTAILFLGRSLEGLGAAASAPALLAHLTDVTEGHAALRARVMSYFELTLLAGLALGGLAGGELWRWQGRSGFAFVAVLYAVSAALLYAGGAGSRGYGASPALTGFKRALRSPALRSLAPVWLCANALVGLWLGPTVAFLLTERGNGSQFLSGIFADDPRLVGWLTFFYAVIFGTGIVIWSFILPRVNIYKVMKIALVAMLGACAGLYLLNHSVNQTHLWRWTVGAATSLCIMTESGFTPAALSLLATIVGAQAGRGAAMGIYSVLLSVGAILGSLLAGWLGARYAMDGIIYGTLALGTIALMLVGQVGNLRPIFNRPRPQPNKGAPQ
jgi:MFS family permease